MTRAGCSDKDLELFWGVLNGVDRISMIFWWTWWPLIFFIPLNSIPWAQKLSWPVQSQERQWSDDAPSLLLEHAAWQFVEGLGGVEGAHARKPHPYLQWELDEINSDELKRFNIIRKNKKTNTPWIFMNFPSTTKWSPIFRSEQRWIWTHHSKTALFPACTAGYCGRAELWVVVGWIWVELNWRNLNEHDWIWGIGVFACRKFLICCDLLFFLKCFHVFHFSTYFEVSWSWMKFRTCIWMHLVSGVFCQGPQVVEVWSCINSEYGAGTVVDSLCLLRCRWLRCAGSATIGRRYHMLNSRGVAARQKIIWGGCLVRRMQSEGCSPKIFSEFEDAFEMICSVFWIHMNHYKPILTYVEIWSVLRSFWSILYPFVVFWCCILLL